MSLDTRIGAARAGAAATGHTFLSSQIEDAWLTYQGESAHRNAVSLEVTR